MSTRVGEQMQFVPVVRVPVPAGSTTTKGLAVVPTTGGFTVAGAAADDAIGVARNTLASAAVVQYCDVALFAHGVVRAKCGTGGSTVGKKQKLVSDGFTDAPADNGAGTAVPTYGYALETAVAGDDFALALTGPANRTTT